MFKNGYWIGYNDRNGKHIHIGDTAKYIYETDEGEDFEIGTFKYFKDLLAIGFEIGDEIEKNYIIFFNTETCPDFNSNDFEIIE